MHSGLSLSRPPAPADPATPHAAHAGTTRECPDCGLFLNLPRLPRRTVARCPRCAAVLRHSRIDPLVRPLALALTGLALMLLAADLPFMTLSVYGVEHETHLISGPVALEYYGMAELGVVILAFTLIAPTARLLAIAYVLAALRTPRPPPHLALVFRWVAWLRPWAMVEVFLLGVFVAYTKLVDLAHVDVGGACYAMAGLMLVMAATDSVLDSQAVWEALPPRGEIAPIPPNPVQPDAALTGPDRLPMLGCHTCGLVSPASHEHCVRCGSLLRARKPHSLSRTWALLAAAACLYIPANILPVLTLVRLDRGEPSTILGGAVQLLDAGMWPLALLVFVASITVPVLKIVSLTFMLLTTQSGSAWRLRERTVLYRVVEFIGRWSMIDVFMISILTALVHLGFFAQVYPNAGVLAFCAVVILTMLAAASFDPRLMWDAAAQRRPQAAPAHSKTVRAGPLHEGAV